MTTHLKGLRVENFKPLTLVDIDFDTTGAVAIMGTNGAGKSSLLDALEAVIAGRKATTFPEPIKHGADSARIVATFDDIIVTRNFKANGTTTIEVKGTDGQRFNSSEDVLKRLYSHVALDPLAFARLNNAEQVAQLLPMIGFDPKPLDDEHDLAYAKRTDENREVKALESRLQALPDPVPNLPAEPVDQVALSDELARALGHNADGDQLTRAEVNAATELAAAARSLADAEAALVQARERATRAQTAATEATAAAAEFEPVDVDGIRERIASADKVNEQIRVAKERATVEGYLKDQRQKVADLTATIDRTKAEKAQALADAKLPVPGMKIDPEDMVLTLDGVPFSQASTGQQVRTGTGIAMALNPNLKLIVIRDASLLDESNRAVIDALAKDNDFLVLMEIADTSQPVGVVIGDGFVQEVRS